MSALDNARAWFEQHRTAVLAGGGAGVVGLALLSKRRKANAAAAQTQGSSASGSMVGQPADPYGTVAYDVYDALQPQVEAGYNNLQRQIDQLNKAQKRRTKPKPTPAPPRNRRRLPAKSPRKPARRQFRKLGGWATANSPTGVVTTR